MGLVGAPDEGNQPKVCLTTETQGVTFMAIMKQLFKWDEVEELGDLERLKLVIDYLPDEELMQALENEEVLRAKSLETLDHDHH
jgi:hypothetical protein